MALALGEMDVARVIPYRFGQGQPPSALGLVPTTPANGGHPIPEGGGHTESFTLIHGGRPPGPDYVGHRGWG